MTSPKCIGDERLVFTSISDYLDFTAKITTLKLIKLIQDK